MKQELILYGGWLAFVIAVITVLTWQSHTESTQNMVSGYHQETQPSRSIRKGLPVQSRTATLPSMPNSSASVAVENYYDALNHRQFRAAYSMLSASAHSRHTYEAFVSYQKDIDFVGVTFGNVHRSIVNAEVTEFHASDPKHSTQFTGRWYLISLDGKHWLLDKGDFDPPKVVALSESTINASNASTVQSTIIATAEPAINEAATPTLAPSDETSTQGSTTSEATIRAQLPVVYFHGFRCKEYSCTGHVRGYEWAKDREIDDAHTCYTGRRLSLPDYSSFSEGCEAYVDESTGAAQLDPSDRY